MATPKTTPPYHDPRHSNRVGWIAAVLAAALILVGILIWNNSDTNTAPTTATTETPAQ